MTRHQDQALATLNAVRQVLRPPKSASTSTQVRDARRRPAASFESLPEYDDIKIKRAVADIAKIDNPFYRLHEGRASQTTTIDGRKVVNFSSYDYLGLNGHPSVSDAAKKAIDDYGTSVSASRLSAGERQVHRDLESALARLHGCEDSLAFVSGHATNVSVIGSLLGPRDLILCDAVIHNSVMEGAKLSGARRILIPHGDMDALERALRLNRTRHGRVLIVVEGLYSMDGDLPDLPALVALKRRYDAWLMVDEAHSVGVLGQTGRGVAEEQGVAGSDVDIWMGTLSKTFASAGGYIAGSRALIEILKYNTPGFVYSVGLAPPVAAAALAAHDLMLAEPWRLRQLRDNGSHFLRGAKARGLNTGASTGAAIIPVIIGNSPDAVVLSERLLGRGFNIFPAIFPGVAENEARLRCFVTSEHQPEQIDAALDALIGELDAIRKGPSFVSRVANR
jgi:8-amino-7-oxononanoate synthase